MRLATSDPTVDQAVDWAPEIALLRQSGADRFDPVQFHFVEVLARRAANQPAIVRHVIDTKLAKAVEALRSRFEPAHRDTMGTHAVEGPLGALARYASQQASANEAGGPPIQYFRNVWSRISTEKQVTQALDQAPKNAGPINSHMLVLRSLALMRDVSPDYLNRFVAYVDTLLSLDQLDRLRPPQGPQVTSGDTSKITKKRGTPGRPRSA